MEALSRWREHIDNLLNINAGRGEEIRGDESEVQVEEGEIAVEEVKWAVRKLKNRKAQGGMRYTGGDGEGGRLYNGAVVEGGV